MYHHQHNSHAFIFAVAAAAGLMIPATANAAQVPSYAAPGGETIHGSVASVSGSDLYVHDDRGFTDHVALRGGTVVTPSGQSLEPGMRVTISGRNGGSAFLADEVDTEGAPGAAAPSGDDPYAYDEGYAYPPAYDYPYYGYPGYYGYGYPYGIGIGLGFYFGGRGGYYGHGYGGGYHGGYGHGYGGGYHGAYAGSAGRAAASSGRGGFSGGAGHGGGGGGHR